MLQIPYRLYDVFYQDWIFIKKKIKFLKKNTASKNLRDPIWNIWKKYK